MISKDTLWKGILEDLFEDFLHFFFPALTAQVDWSRGFEFLDKELEQILPGAEEGPRLADKLVKVFLKTGQEQWLLIHVEVQGYADPSFDERMFRYYYRIFEKYNRPVTAIAIYVDKKHAHQYRQYRRVCFGTELLYRFNSYVLAHHPVEELRAIDNPFALVMETAWEGLKFGKISDDNLYNLKWDLFRRMFGKGYSSDKVRRIGNFIRFHTSFKDQAYTQKLAKAIQKISPNHEIMGIEEAILKEVEEKGMEKGREEGLEKAEAIIKLLRDGKRPEVIARRLKVSEERVLQLKRLLEG